MRTRFDETNPMYETLAWFGIVDRELIAVWAVCGLFATLLHRKPSVLIPAIIFGPISLFLYPPE